MYLSQVVTGKTPPIANTRQKRRKNLENQFKQLVGNFGVTDTLTYLKHVISLRSEIHHC